MSTRLAPLALAVVTLCGCGYHISAHGDLMPKTVKIIAIEPFGNLTTRYKLARTLPADLGHEFLSRTRYKIVADPSQADAVLTGTISNYIAYPTISAGGRSTTVEAVVTLQVTLTNRAT